MEHDDTQLAISLGDISGDNSGDISSDSIGYSSYLTSLCSSW